MRHSNNVFVAWLAHYLFITFLTRLNFNRKLGDILLLHLYFNIAGRVSLLREISVLSLNFVSEISLKRKRLFCNSFGKITGFFN